MITKLKDSAGYQTFHFLPAKIHAGLEYHVCPGKFHSSASTREAWWTRSPRVVCPQVSRVPVYYARTIVSHSKCVESNTEKGLIPQ